MREPVLARRVDHPEKDERTEDDVGGGDLGCEKSKRHEKRKEVLSNRHSASSSDDR
jgi:hypothetical protein